MPDGNFHHHVMQTGLDLKHILLQLDAILAFPAFDGLPDTASQRYGFVIGTAAESTWQSGVRVNTELPSISSVAGAADCRKYVRYGVCAPDGAALAYTRSSQHILTCFQIPFVYSSFPSIRFDRPEKSVTFFLSGTPAITFQPVALIKHIDAFPDPVEYSFFFVSLLFRIFPVGHQSSSCKKAPPKAGLSFNQTKNMPVHARHGNTAFRPVPSGVKRP